MGAKTPGSADRAESLGRIIYDGLNLPLEPGTGAATDTRLLAHIAQTLGYDVGIVYGSAFTPDKDPLLQEVLFLDQMRTPRRLDRQITRRGALSRTINRIIDQTRYRFTVKPLPLPFGEAAIGRQYADLLVEHDSAFIARNLFESANTIFNHTSQFINLSFDHVPNILHLTCPLPLQIRSACNIYTIAHLPALRPPGAMLERKKQSLELLKKIANTADHIVTVSESSKRNIVNILKVDERRITNTYQAIAIPQRYLERSEQAIANYLSGLYGLEMNGYLLSFGALEPKKKIGRLIDAFLASDIDVPLVLVTAPGSDSADDRDRPGELSEPAGARDAAGSPIRRVSTAGLSALVSLVRGARAVIFPSPYDGFSLPIIEAMMLGTPVIAASSGALSEISGDAALLVDPYDIDDLARAIRTMINDADLRRELSRRGTARAAEFSVARYRERIGSLYASLA